MFEMLPECPSCVKQCYLFPLFVCTSHKVNNKSQNLTLFTLSVFKVEICECRQKLNENESSKVDFVIVLITCTIEWDT